MKNNDDYYMLIAIKEAKKGIGFTKTNPSVGAVIVKDNTVISKGYHRKYGGDHAEIDALKKASTDVCGAAMYVTLEPCSTYGKTPPCVDAIIKNGIKRVVIGVLDPNPGHNGKAVKILKEYGIEVAVGVMHQKCRELIKSFTINIKEKRPYVILKLAMTLDGKIAAETGDSKWITNEHSRKLVHKLRHNVDAVMVGKNTAIKDDPSLTVRHIKTKRQPDKVIFDSDLSLPLGLNIFNKSSNERIFLITDYENNIEKEKILQDKGVTLIRNKSHRLNDVLHQLYEFNIGTILLEGGSHLAASFFKEKLIDEIMFFYAPKIIGGDALNSISDLGIGSMKDAFTLKNLSLKKLHGDDFLITGEPVY